MKKINLLAVLVAGVFAVACNGGSSSGGSSTPNPPPPIVGLTTSFSDGSSSFDATTDTPVVTKVMTLLNNGESNVSQIAFTLPSNGYFDVTHDDTGTSPCTIHNQSITNTLVQNQDCTIKVTYNNATVTSSTSANIVFNYLYGLEAKIQTTTVSYVTTSIPSNKVKYVAVGDMNNIWYSMNGNSWTNIKVPASINYLDLNSVTYGNAGFVAVSSLGTSYISSDGKTWTGPYVVNDRNLPLTSIVFANNQYVAVNSPTGSPYDGSSFTSKDGITWAKHIINNTGRFTSIEYANGVYVAVGDNTYSNKPLICQSPDAISWACQNMTPSMPNNYVGFDSVSYGSGVFVAAGYSGLGYYSTDNGNTWQQDNISSSNTIYSMVYGNGTFVAVGIGSNSYTSANAQSWIPHSINAMYPLKTVMFDGTNFWASGYNETFISSDGVNWDIHLIAPSYTINDMIYVPNL